MNSISSMQICRLCLKASQDIVYIWETFKDSTIASILSKHFWFEVYRSDGMSQWLCQICWTQTKTFHDFYKRINFLHVFSQKANEFFEAKKWEQVLGITERTTEPVQVDLNLVKQEQVDVLKADLFTSYEVRNLSQYDDSSNFIPIEHSESANHDNKTSKENDTVLRKKRKVKRTIKSKPENDSKRNLFDPCEEDMVRIRELFTMTCDICSDFKYDSLSAARTHYRKVHKIKGYMMCCGKKFWRRRFILNHLQSHLNPRQYECDHCGKCFTTKQIIQKHIYRHVPIELRAYKCTMCPLSFARKEFLTRHFTSKHRPKSDEEFSCDKCSKSFRSKESLKIHVRNVHEYSLDYVCDICARRFKTSPALLLHNRRNHSASTVKAQCQFCGVWLKNVMSRRMHVARMHHENNLQEIKCKLCKKVAKSKSALDNHIRSVHGERSHQCILCEKAFKCAKNLKEHIACHTGQYLYDCPYCEKKFKSNANMYSHRKKAHIAEWKRDFAKRAALENSSTNLEIAN